MNNVFCKRLKEVRAEKGVSQAQVGKALGLAQNTVAGYENGVREPNLEIVIALCRYYQVSADYLLGLTDY